MKWELHGFQRLNVVWIDIRRRQRTLQRFEGIRANDCRMSNEWCETYVCLTTGAVYVGLQSLIGCLPFKLSIHNISSQTGNIAEMGVDSWSDGVPRGSNRWPWRIVQLKTSAPKRISVLPGTPKLEVASSKLARCFNLYLKGTQQDGTSTVISKSTKTYTSEDLSPTIDGGYHKLYSSMIRLNCSTTNATDNGSLMATW